MTGGWPAVALAAASPSTPTDTAGPRTAVPTRPAAPPPQAGPPALAAATAVPKAEIHDEDLLLLAVDLDGVTLTDALPAYGSPDDPLLPLGELARLLDLNITVSPTERRVSGSLGQAQQALLIDLASGVGRLNGRDLNLTPLDIAATGVDIYVRASALERILPVKITTDVEALQLKLKATEKLPIQARLERVAQLRALRPDVEGAEPALRIVSPYLLFSPPAFDISLQSGGSAISPQFPRGYEIRVADDLLYTGFRGFLGSDLNGQLSSVQATFERHDVKGGLLGPINATSASAGDVFTPVLALGPRGTGGRGFAFTTAPLEQTSVFNHIDLRGDLPIGYDAELYINDVLRSGQRTPVQGRYEFLNVPLVRGLNVIRIVLNGPGGVRSETTRIVNVGGGQLAKGKLTFEMGVVQQDTPLINVQKLAPGQPVTPGTGALRLTADAAYGLTEGVTLIGGLAAYTPPNGLRRFMITAGTRSSFLGFSVQLDAAGDNRGGSAESLGLAGKLFGISTVVRHAEYQGGFLDETVGSGADPRVLVSHSEVDMDFNLQPFKRLLLPLSLGGSYNVFADHSSSLIGSFHSSVTVRDILLSNSVDFQSNAPPPPANVTPVSANAASVALANGMPGALASTTPAAAGSTVTTGNLSASTFYKFRWQLRASLDYDITPKFQVADLSVTADHDLTKTTTLHLGLGQSFAGRDTTFQAGTIMHTRYGDLSVSGNYTTPTNVWQIGVSFAFGLVFDPASRRYVVTRPGPAAGGSVAFDSFVDNSGSGVYEPGDKPVANVSIDGGASKAVTDAKGRVFITGLGSSPTARLQVGLDAIDDPFVESPPHTVIFTPRPGLVIRVPYPITASSELIAHVVLMQDGALVGLSAVRVRLVPEHGTPLEASTEYDGTADFEHLSAGAYDFQLDPEQAERLHMRLKDPKRLVVPATGGSLPDLTAEVVFDRPDAPLVTAPTIN